MSDQPNDPATKQDLTDLRAHVDRRFDRLIEATRDMQTEVLRASHDWARPVELKLRSLPAIEERLGLLEERISLLRAIRSLQSSLPAASAAEVRYNSAEIGFLQPWARVKRRAGQLPITNIMSTFTLFRNHRQARNMLR